MKAMLQLGRRGRMRASPEKRWPIGGRFWLGLILVAGNLQAATYYVANNGNDANDGLSAAGAWRTLDKVNAQGGDDHTFLFQRGDTFRGEITANGKSITYGAYGTGERPSIRGSVVITNWTWDATHTCYVADNTNTLRHLFVNGEIMRIARYPNVDAPNLGWLETDSGSSKNTFYDAALGAYGKPESPTAWFFPRTRLRAFPAKIRNCSSTRTARPPYSVCKATLTRISMETP